MQLSQMETLNIKNPEFLKGSYIYENTLSQDKVGASEYILHAFIMYFLSGAVLYMFSDAREGVSKIIDVIWVLIYCIIFYVARNYIFKIWTSLLKNKFLFFLSLLTLSSYFWSQAPDVTFRRGMSYVACLVYALYLNEKFRNKMLINLFYYLACLIVITSIISVIVMPEYAIAKGVHSGAWQGVYFHKNGLGRISGLSLISIILYLKISKSSNLFSIIIAILCAVLLVMSKSSTSIIAFVFVIPSYCMLKWTYKNYNAYKSILNVTITFSLAFLVIYFFNNISESLFNGFGKDDSFTGRLPLWTMLFDYISASPIYGYGYSAFWIPKILSKNIWLDTDWDPEQGHNGFIDITLELGIMGLILFLIVLIKGYNRSFKLIKNNQDESGYWYILTLIFLTVVSFTESFILKYNNIYWVMLLLCCVGIQNPIFLIKKNFLKKS